MLFKSHLNIRRHNVDVETSCRVNVIGRIDYIIYLMYAYSADVYTVCQTLVLPRSPQAAPRLVAEQQLNWIFLRRRHSILRIL